MKFTVLSVFSLLASASAFAFTPQSKVRAPTRTALDASVGVVGATGAVGKEIGE